MYSAEDCLNITEYFGVNDLHQLRVRVQTEIFVHSFQLHDALLNTNPLKLSTIASILVSLDLMHLTFNVVFHLVIDNQRFKTGSNLYPLRYHVFVLS